MGCDLWEGWGRRALSGMTKVPGVTCPGGTIPPSRTLDLVHDGKGVTVEAPALGWRVPQQVPELLELKPGL